MKNLILNDDHHEALLLEGLQYIETNVPSARQKLLLFAEGICLKMVSVFGKEKIVFELNLSDYSDENFAQYLSYSIEFGVPVFLINNNLFTELIDNEKILPVTVAINLSIANDIAMVFKRLGFRHSKTSCVYSNEALCSIVGRTMGRYEEMDLSELKSFAPLFQ